MKFVVIALIIIAAIIALIALIAGVVAFSEIIEMMKGHSERMKKMSDKMIQIKKKE